MLAKINGLFRLTRDAELIVSQSGTEILKLGLACSEKRGDTESQLFLDAVAFGKPATIISQYSGSKGSQLFLSGKLQTESWKTQQGENRSKVSMVIESFEFVGGKKESQQQYQDTQAQGIQQHQQQNPNVYQPQQQQYVPPQQPQVVHEDIHPNQSSFDMSQEVPF